MKYFIKYALARASERSTWLGLISLMTGLGLSLSADQANAVIAAGISAAGIIAAFTKDPGKKI